MFSSLNRAFAYALSLMAMTASVDAQTNTFWVFNNGLASGWGDYTWAGVANYNSTDITPLQGTYVAKLTVTSPWAGLQPYAINLFDISGYSKFTFAVWPTRDGQTMQTQFHSAGDTAIGQALDIGSYGGNPVKGQWNVYHIPLADFGFTNKIILKFGLQDETGVASNVIYFCNIGFVSNSNPPAGPPPALGITTYSNQPVVIFPTATGTGYVLQTTTNLASGNWVTVTNGVPFTGVEIINAPGTAFFRLQ
jgi:hypothetical protein